METKYKEVTIETINPLNKEQKKGKLWLYFKKHLEEIKETYYSYEIISQSLSKNTIAFNMILDSFYIRCNKDIEQRINK